MKNSPALLTAVVLTAGVGTAALADEGRVLWRQKEEVHFKCDDRKAPVQAIENHVEVRQKEATALHIRGEVRTLAVTGVPGLGTFGMVVNLNYAATPVYWDTNILPDTGTHPWQMVDKYVRARLPVQSLDIKWYMGQRTGEAWFRNFIIEETPDWKDPADLVVANFGDSTTMSYTQEECYRASRRLELLLRDRFPEKNIRVDMFGESGGFLRRLIETGQLERELNTLDRCDIVTIRYGLNDPGNKTTPEEFKRLLNQAIDIVLKKFPHAVVMPATTIPPYAREYSEATRQVARERNLPLIDIAATLEKEAARGNWNWHSHGAGREIGYRAEQNPVDNPTGLKGDKHPNPYGSQLIAEDKFRLIEPIAAKLLAPDK